MKQFEPTLIWLLVVAILINSRVALAQPERILIQDKLAGQTTGKQQGAGGFAPEGGWRSAGGRIVYDAGEAIEKGFFEATRTLTPPDAQDWVTVV